MPIPSGFSRYVWSGTLASGEIFQTGFWASGSFADEATADAAATTEASNIATDMASYWSSHQASSCALNKITIYSYPTGGPTASIIGQATVSGVVGTQSTGIMPDQVCTVATLLTGAAGRRNRGRMYIPLTSAVLDSSAQVPVVTTDALALALATHFARFDTSPPGVVVLSQIAGTARRVNSVVVDSRVDIQRRRADRQTIARKSTHAVA